MAVNARGIFLCYKHAATQMIAQGRGGRIIGASSIAGKVGFPLSSAYAASKFAVRGLTQTAGKDRTFNVFLSIELHDRISTGTWAIRHHGKFVCSWTH